MKRFFKRLSTRKQESNLHSSPVKSSWPSVSSDNLPATGNGRRSNATPQEFQQSNIPAARLTEQQEHDSTEAARFGTAPLPTAELDKQATQPPSRQPYSMHDGTPILHAPRSREALVSDSAFAPATKLASRSIPSDLASQNSKSSSRQQPASIYKSYNDFDILSSGTFDFSQHHLLSSAPDADWLNAEPASHRLSNRPNTAGQKPESRVSYPWEPEPTRTPSPQDQPASQPDSSRRHIPQNPAQFSSHHESARSRNMPYNEPSPMAARHNAGLSPVNQPMMTPFAKYASRSLSGASLSVDLDTAMRAKGQAPVQALQNGFHDQQTSGKQHELLAFSRIFCHAACTSGLQHVPENLTLICLVHIKVYHISTAYSFLASQSLIPLQRNRNTAILILFWDSAMHLTVLTIVNHQLMVLIPLHCFAGIAGTLNRSHAANSRTQFDLPHPSGTPVTAPRPKSSDGHRPPVPLPYSPRSHRLPTSPTHGMPIGHQKTAYVGRIEVSCCFHNK